MPTKPAFKGLQLDFLIESLQNYKETVNSKDWDAFILGTTYCFFKCFNPSLPDNEKSNKEYLMGVDNDAPDEKMPLPEVGTEAYEERVKNDMAVGEQKKVIGKDKKQEVEKKVKEFREMSIKKRRQVEKRWEDGNVSGLGSGTRKKTKNTTVTASRKSNTNVADYQSAVMWCFDNLPVEEQKMWEQKAFNEHWNASNEFDQMIKLPPSTSPKDRQLCIHNLPNFMEDIADIIHQCM
ncbi:hypothetical protein GYMLUDRAFT_247102 [Collybiopsis luxurians FD-317 M1]|uniref:Uncharacterized protein n=1 Tax=Collybiopsis luxurians FD-317 M1 TaxID=944289 RepID=A0A0D0BQP4_9AGAR|nr:hypothetical protein GYMLUDRAFT_247102 [Collybiopsis luxurians FD-317 M1]